MKKLALFLSALSFIGSFAAISLIFVSWYGSSEIPAFLVQAGKFLSLLP